MAKFLLLLFSLLASTAACAAQERSDDPLAPLTECVNRDGFQFRQRDRLPVSATGRMVSTRQGELSVSTADGYRLMMFRRSNAPLVNLKLERSFRGRFADDRAAITTQVQDIAAASKAPHQIVLDRSTQQGIEILGLNFAEFGQASGVISHYTLFDERSGTIATAYLLNQRPEVREFANEAEYLALREQFITLLAGCLATAGQASGQP
ncbi:hypothetical protein ACFFKC_11205 [Pseudoduganella danionis]|uniref:Uncharacterized protein n=1 Tax=Pseudoduganella danionis TaxID=1890295 RepID=A0ABW9SPT9_9BURK|nr:hypothetical protein [Pseudoduganella danionis]MTW32414.1 hypothetical protein [Pseudoduganella danionis]